MSQLKIILIDVAWGDSIFLEATDSNGNEHYALIDSNDTTNYKSSLIFLRRYFQKKFRTSKITKPTFDWVMLSHAHLDHGEGLKEIMRMFGTKNFFYPRSLNNSSLAHLQSYANRAQIHHQAIDDSSDFPKLGDAEIDVLWPRDGHPISDNENDNSIVLAVSQNDQTCMFTGDAEEDVWSEIHQLIPANTAFFKVPHHGSRNGSLDGHGNPTWSSHTPTTALAGMSTHNRPYNHPHQEVLDVLDGQGIEYLRTDDNYHIEIVVDVNGVTKKYSH